MVKDGAKALSIVLILTVIFVVCLVSAMQLLKPHDMPFGITESSPVVSAVEDEASLDIIEYSSESALIAAAERGDIYGGYVVGDASDTIVTVPAKSFFGEIYVRGGLEDAAKKADRETTTKVVAPLPTSDRTGGVVGLLMLPTLIGGYLIATMLFSFTKRAAVVGRIAIILSFSVLVAIITGIAALITDAVPVDQIWALLPCFALVTVSVALAGVAIQHFAGKMGTLIIALFFIVIGGASAGGVGVALLPNYWQVIGAIFPPRHAIELYRNVMYFGGSNILGPLLVLTAYAVIGALLIVAAERRRQRTNTTPITTADAAAAAARPTKAKIFTKDLIAPIGFAVLLTTIFGFNYLSSGHAPIAKNMPFGLVGSSTLPHDAQNGLFSLNVIDYADEAAATAAMQEGKIYGAFIAGESGASAGELIVVSSISDLSPLDIAGNFKKAAEAGGDTITVKPYEPTPLAPGDPFALVCSLLLVPLLVSGYMATTLLTNTQRSASGRWRALWLLGFAVAAAVVVAVIAIFLLQALPVAMFWISIPIMTLIILSVALFAAVLRRLFGPVGIFLTVIIVIQFGNPSSGGANGVPYLSGFWSELGPFLPPRNAYLLLRDAAYFGGHGIGEPLTVLLIYAALSAALLVAFDWFIDKPALSTPGIKDEDANSAAVLAPVGPPP